VVPLLVFDDQLEQEAGTRLVDTVDQLTVGIEEVLLLAHVRLELVSDRRPPLRAQLLHPRTCSTENSTLLPSGSRTRQM
jgi:hypothetical protein